MLQSCRELDYSTNKTVDMTSVTSPVNVQSGLVTDAMITPRSVQFWPSATGKTASPAITW